MITYEVKNQAGGKSTGVITLGDALAAVAYLIGISGNSQLEYHELIEGESLTIISEGHALVGQIEMPDFEGEEEPHFGLMYTFSSNGDRDFELFSLLVLPTMLLNLQQCEPQVVIELERMRQPVAA